jgi:hypothetical protein
MQKKRESLGSVPKDDDGNYDQWLVMGHQPRPPRWLSEFDGLHFRHLNFVHCDQKEASIWQLPLQLHNHDHGFSSDYAHLQQVVVSIRPPLIGRHTFAQASRINNDMVTGLVEFLKRVIQVTIQHKQNNNEPQQHSHNNHPTVPLLHIIHISSIAAIDHVQEQRFRSELSFPDPSSDALYHPYDRFKRRCEEVLDELAALYPQYLRITHLRLGAIFSDDPSCIQCRALALQAHLGCYLRTRIDCNSGRNVAILLQAILKAAQPPKQLIRYFFYTRPLSVTAPVPYGEYLKAYRLGNDILIYAWLPMMFVVWIVTWVHAIALRWPWLPYIQSIDYLLQVTRREHTFDLSLIGTAYPGVANQEETIVECFRRRRWYIRNSNASFQR